MSRSPKRTAAESRGGLSLAPLNLREALDALLRVKPDDEPPKKVRRKAGDEKAGDEPDR